ASTGEGRKNRRERREHGDPSRRSRCSRRLILTGSRTRHLLGLGFGLALGFGLGFGLGSTRSHRSSDSSLADSSEPWFPAATALPWRSWRGWRSFLTPGSGPLQRQLFLGGLGLGLLAPARRVEQRAAGGARLEPDRQHVAAAVLGAAKERGRAGGPGDQEQ